MQLSSLESTPLTSILIRALESVPAREEICRMLEQVIAEAMPSSSRKMTPQDLIFSHLCHYGLENTQGGFVAYASDNLDYRLSGLFF